MERGARPPPSLLLLSFQRGPANSAPPPPTSVPFTPCGSWAGEPWAGGSKRETVERVASFKTFFFFLSSPLLVKLSAALTMKQVWMRKFVFYLRAKGTFWSALTFPLCTLEVYPGGMFKCGSNVTRIIYRWFKVEPPLTPNLGVLLCANVCISVGDCYVDHVHATDTARGPARCCGTRCKKME